MGHPDSDAMTISPVTTCPVDKTDKLSSKVEDQSIVGFNKASGVPT